MQEKLNVKLDVLVSKLMYTNYLYKFKLITQSVGPGITLAHKYEK